MDDGSTGAVQRYLSHLRPRGSCLSVGGWVLVRPPVFTVPSVRRLPCCGWPRFVVGCLRAFVRPPARRCLASAPRGTFLLAQESTQRRAPGFRPGTLLQGPRAGGAELAAPSAPLRHPAPSSGPRTLPQGAPYGRGRSKPTVPRRVRLSAAKRTVPHAVRHPDAIRYAHRHPTLPGARYTGAARNGQRPSVPKMSESLAIIHWQERRDRRCLDLPPRCRRAEWRGFSRDSRRWMSERSRRRSEFSAAREKPRSEGNPGPRSGPGSRQSGVFLGYFFARAKK